MFNALKHNPVADAILRRPPVAYSAARRELERFAALSLEQRRAERTRQIKRTLRTARALQGYAGAPLSDNLSDWPILTKKDILGREKDFATKLFYPAPAAETGGTSGQPLRMVRAISGIAREQALIDTLCAAQGIDLRKARVAILRGDSILLPDSLGSTYWIDEGRHRRFYSAQHISPATRDIFIHSLRDYAPDVVFCYPSSLLALTCDMQPIDGLRIPLVFSSSEVLHPSALARARHVLGCDIIDFYGHAERIVCASALNGSDHRFHPGYGHVELLPCGDGRARILATSLIPAGQVFVRYETGDIAVCGTDDPETLERIALGCEPFAAIEGRDSEYLELADGRKIVGLNHIPRGADGAASVQLHHSAEDCVDIYVVPAPGLSARTSRRIIDNFYAKVPQRVRLRVWHVGAPVRQPNGKAPLLLNNPVLPADRILQHDVAGAAEVA